MNKREQISRWEEIRLIKNMIAVGSTAKIRRMSYAKIQAWLKELTREQSELRMNRREFKSGIEGN